MSRPRATGAADSRCPSCAAPLLTQWVGAVAALKVTADPRPLTSEQQIAVREPNRLVWCLYRASAHSPPRLRWITASHPPTCDHPHVTEHRCPPAEPTTLF
ncbi:hypothetical protein PUR59_04330 [Streptomyces sp. SP18ES09]|uniref:hypothetical protein n=1 Tax=Streptomyces sp. SP18ES09 TaxID=3002532 RepID=UPI002E79E7BE|nr:hypothetical protein [Streptomyces sp. SP18ES09]MEE1814248.1 hypothetical protein [Streptomyces sp. SP18ES09]